MSTSQGVNVLRYSALLFGVFYGFSHQRTLNSQAKAAHAEHEYHNKEHLIQQAKKAFAEKKNPTHLKGDGVITDPDDKRFDLEAALKKLDDDSRKGIA